MRSRSEKRRIQSFQHLTADLSSISFHRGLLQAFDLLQNAQWNGIERHLKKGLLIVFCYFWNDFFYPEGLDFY